MDMITADNVGKYIDYDAFEDFVFSNGRDIENLGYAAQAYARAFLVREKTDRPAEKELWDGVHEFLHLNTLCLAITGDPFIKFRLEKNGKGYTRESGTALIDAVAMGYDVTYNPDNIPGCSFEDVDWTHFTGGRKK